MSIGIPCSTANEINHTQWTTKFLSHQSPVHICCPTSSAVNICTPFKPYLTGLFNTTNYYYYYFFVHLVLEYFDKTNVLISLLSIINDSFNITLRFKELTCQKIKIYGYIFCITGSVSKLQWQFLCQPVRSLGCKYICWTIWREHFSICLHHYL